MIQEITVMVAAAQLLVELYKIVQGTIKRHTQIQAENAKTLSALRAEVRTNLDTVNYLLDKTGKFLKAGNKGALAVHDPVIRKALAALRFTELKKTSDAFDPIVGRFLKTAKKKEPTKKDPIRIFWNIHDAAAKLEDLDTRMKKVPAKHAPNAPRVLLMRRLPALKWRLEAIDQALKIIPVKEKKKKEKGKGNNS
jgi:hypothetical protein